MATLDGGRSSEHVGGFRYRTLRIQPFETATRMSARTSTLSSQARRIAFGLVAFGLVAMTILPAGQVIRQAFWPLSGPTHFNCREGTRALLRATERARQTVQSDSSQTVGHALSLFRAALEPEWREEAAILAQCNQTKDGQAIEALRTVVFLRYAEERAVRAESLDLARLRVKAPALVERLKLE